MAPSTRLSHTVYLEHLRADSARFRAALTDCDPTARVPACPDWDAGDLLWHLAEVQWFWGSTILARPEKSSAEHPPRPASYAELLSAFDAFSSRLVDALAQAEPSDAAWHWTSEQTVAASFRRQAHEALIHRLDAEQTAGTTSPVDAALAADGVAEMLEWMYGGEPPSWARVVLGDAVLRLEMPDAGVHLFVAPGELTGTHPESGTVQDGPHLLLVGDPGREPDATITARAADLDTWLWKRHDGTGIERSGDPAAQAAFTAAVTPPIE